MSWFTWSSLICVSSALRSFSCDWAWSCSALSSSANLAASTIAFFAFSSEFLASLSSSSRSACRVCSSLSSFLLAADALVAWALSSFSCSWASLSSCYRSITEKLGLVLTKTSLIQRWLNCLYGNIPTEICLCFTTWRFRTITFYRDITLFFKD